MSKPLHIGIVVASNGIGGAEKYLFDLISALENKSLRYTFILPRSKTVRTFFIKKTKDFLLSDINYKSPSQNSFSEDINKQFLSFKDFIKSSDFDFFIVNNPWIDFSIGTVNAILDKGVPLLSIIHLVPWKVNLNPELIKIIQGQNNKGALFATVSKDNRLHLSSSIGIPKMDIQVIYNFREVAFKKSLQKRKELIKRFDFPENAFISISIGRFNHQKNYLDILASIGYLNKQINNHKHIILGSGELLEDFKEVVVTGGLSDIVFFPGFITDIDNIIAGADLFISTSLYEGFALSILEVAYAEVPVLASEVSSFREIIPSEDCGLTYTPGSIVELSQKILYAHKNPKEVAIKAEKLKNYIQIHYSRNTYNEALMKAINKASSKFRTQKKKLKNGQFINNLKDFNFTLSSTSNEIFYRAQKKQLDANYQHFLIILKRIGRLTVQHNTLFIEGKLQPDFFRKNLYEHKLAIWSIDYDNDRIDLQLILSDYTSWGQEIIPLSTIKVIIFDAQKYPIEQFKKLKTSNQIYFSYHQLKELSSSLSYKEVICFFLELINQHVFTNLIYWKASNKFGYYLHRIFNNKKLIDTNL